MTTEEDILAWTIYLVYLTAAVLVFEILSFISSVVSNYFAWRGVTGVDDVVQFKRKKMREYSTGHRVLRKMEVQDNY